MHENTLHACCCGVACRERGWKLKQAKRFVRAVKASKLDVESRAEVRQQQQQQ
jgi:hypothetical protein